MFNEKYEKQIKKLEKKSHKKIKFVAVSDITFTYNYIKNNNNLITVFKWHQLIVFIYVVIT